MAAESPRAEMLSVGVAPHDLRTQGEEFAIFRGRPEEVFGFGIILSRLSIATPWRMCSTCPHWIRIAFGIETAMTLGVAEDLLDILREAPGMARSCHLWRGCVHLHHK